MDIGELAYLESQLYKYPLVKKDITKFKYN